MIQVQHFSKTLRQGNNRFKVLDNISFPIPEGRITGIISSSGAGKSTLLRCLNYRERPDEGTVIIRGANLAQLSSKTLTQKRRKMSMVFQHFHLLTSKTVFENIAFPFETGNLSKVEITKKVNRLLDIVGLRNKAKAYPRCLSGGTATTGSHRPGPNQRPLPVVVTTRPARQTGLPRNPLCSSSNISIENCRLL